MSDEKVLIIDDEPDIQELLSMTLRHMDIDCDVASTCQEGMRCIETNAYFLVLSDMRLPDGSGYDIVKFVQAHHSDTPIAVITAYGNVEGAVNTLKAGAFDYVSKPVDLEMLKNLVKTALVLRESAQANASQLLVGETPCMQQLKQKIKKIARSQAPVFIQGESGSGKELVARMIHQSGPRADKAFVPVNCGAIASELMESDFFGHVKGSFTGAVSDKEGLFSAAHGGTLFLDEIAELPLAMQVKLLRAIQERAIRPIGGLSEEIIDVRILSASNKDLLEEISHNHFRQDLYYRVNVLELKVPSLRERKDDIPLIAEALIKKITTTKTQLSEAALKRLHDYDFPGNVRELENILERAVTLCEGERIESCDLQLTPQAVVPSQKGTPNKSEGLDASMEEHERRLIIEALEKTKWNKTAAAKRLGISFRVLRYRLKKLNID